MKKKIFLVTLLALIAFPLNMFAIEKDDYTSKNLEETLTEEEIEHDLSKYKENDKQVTIYLFRGHGCGYCKKFLTFLNSIVDEYGDYFKLESYEVWNDDNNYDLMNQVASFLGTSVSGVPFIVIGDTTFAGYAERYDDSIKSTIKSLYDSKEKYDVFEEMTKKEEEEANANKPSRKTMVVLNFVFVLAGTVIVIVMNNRNTKVLTQKIESLETELSKIKESKEKEKKESSHNAEVKEEVKSKSTKNKSKK